MSDAHHATIRAALEYMKDDSRNLRIQLDSQGYDRTLADIDAALAYLDTLAALDAMPQPSWADAPEWAMWWAMQANGAAFWYEREPAKFIGYNGDHSEGWIKGGRSELAYKPGANWRTTLRARDATGGGEVTS